MLNELKRLDEVLDQMMEDLYNYYHREYLIKSSNVIKAMALDIANGMTKRERLVKQLNEK